MIFRALLSSIILSANSCKSLRVRSGLSRTARGLYGPKAMRLPTSRTYDDEDNQHRMGEIENSMDGSTKIGVPGIP